MEVGKFPDKLKLGKITPIYKKESDELLENYRPVSTLPIFGEIFKKIFKKIIPLYPKESCMIDNLGLVGNTQQAMH